MLRLERPRTAHALAVLLVTVGAFAPWARRDPTYTGPEYAVVFPDTHWGVHGMLLLSAVLCYLVFVSVVRFSFDEERSVTRLTGVAVGVLFAIWGLITIRSYLPDGVTYSPTNESASLGQAMLTPDYGIWLFVAGGIALVIVNLSSLWSDADE